MQKHFSATTVAGLYTGVLLGSFRDIHDAAEHLMGHPIWVHEFADRRLWEMVKEKLSGLFSDISESAGIVEGCNSENVEQKVVAINERWPQGFTFERGSDERTEDPISSLDRIAPDKEIMEVTDGEPASS